MIWEDVTALGFLSALGGWVARYGFDIGRRVTLAYVDYRAARAKHDHADTWEDTFWPRLRAQLHKGEIHGNP